MCKEFVKKTLKPIGIIFLILGLIWLVGNAIYTDPLARALTGSYYAKINALESNTLNKGEVRSIVKDAISDLHAMQPPYTYPGLLMLVGGLMLAFCKPRKKENENT